MILVATGYHKNFSRAESEEPRYTASMERETKTACVITVLTGAAIWLVIEKLGHRREAWDCALYFKAGIPLAVLAAAVAGAIQPARPWRWGLLVLFSQAGVAFIQNPTGNLMPLGLIVFAVLSIPAIMTAYLGAWIFGRRRPATPPSA